SGASTALSPPAIDAQRRFYQRRQRGLASPDPPEMDREQQADLQILRNNLGMSLLELDTIQSYRHNPTVYVELAGNALYTPYLLNYGPLQTRFGHIIKRLAKNPALVTQAQTHPHDTPPLWYP